MLSLIVSGLLAVMSMVGVAATILHAVVEEQAAAQQIKSK